MQCITNTWHSPKRHLFCEKLCYFFLNHGEITVQLCPAEYANIFWSHLSNNNFVCIYIYIYTYTYICIYSKCTLPTATSPGGFGSWWRWSLRDIAANAGAARIRSRCHVRSGAPCVLPPIRERGSAPKGGRHSTICVDPRWSSACQVPICAEAAWLFDNPHQQVVPRSRIPRSASHFSYSPTEKKPAPWSQEPDGVISQHLGFRSIYRKRKQIVASMYWRQHAFAETASVKFVFVFLSASRWHVSTPTFWPWPKETLFADPSACQMLLFWHSGGIV